MCGFMFPFLYICQIYFVLCYYSICENSIDNFFLKQTSVAKKGGRKEALAAPGLSYTDVPNAQIRKVISIIRSFC